LNAFAESGLVPGATTASRNLRPQRLDLLFTKEHQWLHSLWNAFAEARGAKVLQTLPGNGQRLVRALQQKTISPTRVLQLLEEFYTRPDVVDRIG
jgi:hypothetical protein